MGFVQKIKRENDNLNARVAPKNIKIDPVLHQRLAIHARRIDTGIAETAEIAIRLYLGRPK